MLPILLLVASPLVAQINPDGNTKTTVSSNGNVTSVTTSTVNGNNAYNSFSTFNAGSGSVTNLYLPGGTSNLLNLVNSQTVNIDGILNAIENGKIGGNVFFADPYGVIVGASGVVNVGSFTALTPTQDFMSQFFTSPGVPSSGATAAILNGTVPISPDGLISIKGTVNANGNVGLYGGTVSNSGVIQSGAVFSGSSSDFSDVVNTNGLQNGTSIAIQNGNIVIQAAGNVENAGSIATNGGNDLNAGNVKIQAGGNVNLDSNSLVSASGRGSNSNGGIISIKGEGNGQVSSGAAVAATGGNVSGNGGTIDLSAKGTLTVDSGTFNTGAAQGAAGTVTFDPTNLNLNGKITTNGGALNETGDTITVAPGTVVSSRQIGAGTDQLNSPSIGNSGNISFVAPQITVGDGAEILANATGLYSAGDISMTATDSETANPLTGAASANASINIGNATIEGNNVYLSASATGIADNSIVSLVTKAVNDLVNGLPILGSAQGLTSTANASINVGGGAGGTALIKAAGEAKIISDASSSTKIDASGQVLAFAYGDSTATSSATVANTATIHAGTSFDLKSSVDNELDIKNDSTGTGASSLAVSYGKASSTSTAQVDGTVTAGDIMVESENKNSFATEASDTGSSTVGAGGGVGVAVSNYQSNANTNADGTLTAKTGNVDISSSSTNKENVTRSESEVSDTSAKGAIESSVPFLSSLDSYLSSQSGKEKPESNPSALGIAAAVTVANSTNKAATTVTGTVTSSSGDVNVDGTATDNPQISAAGSAGGSTATLGGAVAVGNYSNEADAYVQGSAVVTADGAVAVNADAEIPNPFSNLLSDITNAFDFSNIDFSQPVVNNQNTGWGQALATDSTNLANVAQEVQTDLGSPGNVLTSFTNTGVSAAESGSSVGIGGSVNLLTLSNQSNASVSGTASVTSTTGDVGVNATSNASMINAAGMAFSLDQLKDLNPGVSAGSSLGGSYAGVTLDNGSNAYIGDNTVVSATAGNVNVNSDTETFALDIVQSGDKAKKFGITGAFNVLNLNDTSEAYIQSDATVNARQDVKVNATNNLRDFAITGALGTGGTVQVGVTTGWNQVNNKTLAYIGDPSNTRSINDICSGCGVTAGNNVNVNAHSTENVYAISLAASKSGASGAGADGESSTAPTVDSSPSTSGSSPEPTAGKATPAESAPSGKGASKGKTDGKGGAYGFGVSANIAFNKFVNPDGGPGIDTQAFINNGSNVTAQTGDIGVNAHDDSFLVAVGVSGALAQSAALAGALSWNKFNKEVDAFTTDTTLTGKGLNINATNNGGFWDFSAGGSVNTEEGLAFAGSVNRNEIINNTNAYAGDGTGGNIGADGITVGANMKDTVVSVPGGFAVATTTAGVGAAVDIGIYTNNTNSYIGSAQLGTSQTGNVQVTANTTENLYPIAFEVAGGAEFSVAGSVAWETLNNDTEAYISGQYADIYTPDNILVSANDTTNRLQIAGDISGSGESGFGISGAVNISTRKVQAYIGPSVTVNAGGNGTPLKDGSDSVTGIRVHASQGGKNQLYAAGGAGAGGAGGAGSAVVNVLHDTTKSYVAAGAQINQQILSPAADDSVEILADDVTNLLSLGGAGGFGGEAGIGAGADVTVIHKDTEAYIGDSSTTNPAKVSATDNVKVEANSTEDLSSMAATAGVGGSTGVAGAASVYVVNNKTKAYIGGNDTVFSQGNVLVSAQDNTDLDSIVGNLAVGGAVGVGASVPVDVFTKDTEAWIGSGASVTALGLSPAISANDGQFSVDNQTNFAFGEVPSPHLPSSILNVDNDPALQTQRLATPQTTSIKGVAVTAASTTSNKSMVVAGDGSGSLGASISSEVTVTNLNTKAYVGPNAQVNVNNDAGAGTDQSVLVAAGSDYYHMAMLGAASITGEGGGAAPAVDVAVASNNTSAYVGQGATVDAAKDVSVVANGAEDFLSVAAGLSGSGFIGIAGSVSVTALNDQTYAYLAGATNSSPSSTVNAGGNVLVSANDATKTDSVDGQLAVGIEGGAAGGSVAVTTLNKDTQAYVGGGATVNAGGNSDPISLINGGSASGLVVQAKSNEDLFSAELAGSGGAFVGAAGAVSVENVHSNTSAYIGGAAKINQNSPGASNSQAVNVEADNQTTIKSYDGSLGVGAGAIAGGVDVGIVDNNTSADIGNDATVNALGGIGVSSQSTKDLSDVVASAAAGLVSVPGAVSVFAVGTGLDSQSHSYTNGVGDYADSQTDTSSITGKLPTSDAATQATTDANNASSSAQVSPALNGTTIVPAGTSAFIGNNATVIAGSDINVNSNQTLDLSMTDGSGSISGASYGASVGVANIKSDTQAYVGDSANLSTQGNILVRSALNEDNLDAIAANGNLGGFSYGGAITVLNDTTNTDAYLDNNVTAAAKGSVGISAERKTNIQILDGNLAVGGGGVGGSVSLVNKNDTVNSYVGDNASVTALGQGSGITVPVDNGGSPGTGTINGLSVTATAYGTWQTAAVGATGAGLGLAGSGSAITNNLTDNTSAKIHGGATINGNNAGAASGQGVNLLASDGTNLTTGAGALAGSLVGVGIGVALDFGNIQKTTVAGIDNGATVNALGAVNVDALSKEQIASYVAAVGVGTTGLAGTTSDYTTNPITTTTSAYVGSCANSTNCGGGATVNAGSLGVDAKDSLTFNAIAGELSAGSAALGAGTFEVVVNDNTSASIGELSNITTNSGGVNLSSTFGDNLSGTALAGSGGAVSGDAALGSITDNSDNSALIADGTSIHSSGDVGVTANTARDLSATTGALGVGGLTAGAVVAKTKTKGLTSAAVGNNVNLTAADLNISADDNGTASSSGTALSAGIGGGQFNNATADLGGSVTGSIANNDTINVANDFAVNASGESNSSASITGVDAAGLAVGVSRSEAKANPTIAAYIGDNGTISAGHDLSVAASYTSNGVSASGSMSSGSLANISGLITSYAHADNSPTVSASVGDNNNANSTLSAGHNLTISSTSDTDAGANFNGVALSGVNVPGNTEATANINNLNAVSVGPNVALSAGNDLLLEAQTSNFIPYATVKGTNYGLLVLNPPSGKSGQNSNGTTANACIDSPGTCGYGGSNGGTSVSVNPGDALTAGNSATIKALSGDSADDVKSNSTVGGLYTQNNNTVNVAVNDNPFVSVTGASVNAPTVNLEAEVNQMLVSADASSKTTAANSNSTATSTVNVTADPGVFLSGANISGPGMISINASVSSDPGQVNSSNKAEADIEAGVTGSLTATATNNTSFHPTVSTDSATTLTTSDLEVNVNSPAVPNTGSNPYYSNVANAQNNTVVYWTEKTTQEVVDKVFGWIPFVGPLIEKVTKTIITWVKHVTNSSTNAPMYGAFKSSPSVNINGTIYQSAGQNPVLVANSDGTGGVTFTTDTNVPVTVSGNDIVVGDLTNNLSSKININAPNGTVGGNFTVHRNTGWTNVDITNNTGDNLIISGIQPQSSNGNTADVNVNTNTNNLTYNFVTDNTAADIAIQNNSGSNVTFNGFVNNPGGSLEATNSGGNIFGGLESLFLVNQLSLTADNGSIGSADSFLNAEMESDNSNGASLSAWAGGNLFLNATLVQNVVSGTSLAGYAIPGVLNVDSIHTGGNTNLNLGQPQALVNSVDSTTGARTVSHVFVNGVYNVGDAVTAGDDVNLNVSGAPLNLYGLLKAGGTANVADTGNSIYNGGNGQLVQATDIIFSAPDGQIGTGTNPLNVDLTGGSVSAGAKGDIDLNAPLGNLPTGTINSVLGNVDLTAVGNVGVGSISSLNGTTHIAAFGSILDAENSSTTDINASYITLAAGGSIGSDSNALNIETPNALNSTSNLNTNITENTRDFNIGKVTSVAGNVMLRALNGNLNLGTVNATHGAASLIAQDSILDGDAPSNASDINANSINLTAVTGTIGSDTSPLQINSSLNALGLVSGQAKGNINLNEVVGSLNVGAITSNAGNVNLTAPHGDVSLGTVRSTSGATTITADGSILDPGNETNITAVNVNLTAQNGSIGTSMDPIAIDSSNASPGMLTASAYQDAFITEVNGNLNVNTVTSKMGDVDLAALAGDVILGTVNAKQGTATVSASGSVLDGDAPSNMSDINANSINLAATTGTIGTDNNPLQIDSSINAQGFVSGLAKGDVNLNETAGSLNVGTITSSWGNGNLTVPDGDANLGTVNSIHGTTNITASNSILNAFGSQLGLANINAENINLKAANGSIGTSGTMLTINSSDASSGVVNGLADLGVYLDQLSGALNVDSIESQRGDIVIRSDGSILNASTSGSYTPGINLTGNNITLTSTHGSIGASGNRLIVDNRNADTIMNGMPDGNNYLDMAAQGDIYVKETGGNLLSHSISSTNGNIDLLASNGNGFLNQVIGNENVATTVKGSLLDINTITGPYATTQKTASPNNVSLTVMAAGGTLNVDHMDVFHSVTTRADNTTLADVVHTNLANPSLDTDVQAAGLHFDDAGATGGIASNIDINVSPCTGCTTTPAVIFDNYQTQTGKVTASVDWLEFVNTIVGTSATFQNNWLNIQLNNKNTSKPDTPWYLFMIGNHTAKDLNPIEFYRSTFLQQGVHPTYAQPIGTIETDLLTSYGFLQ